jgi:hypothetical protein
MLTTKTQMETESAITSDSSLLVGSASFMARIVDIDEDVCVVLT